MVREIRETYRRIIPKGELIKGWNAVFRPFNDILEKSFGASKDRDNLETRSLKDRSESGSSVVNKQASGIASGASKPNGLGRSGS
ncbi:glucitol operon activator protein GutM [Sphingopyxis sp. FD7]|nr:glucitol operon activator protein GutM [Sphingopyxis sp. FD7]